MRKRRSNLRARSVFQPPSSKYLILTAKRLTWILLSIGVLAGLWQIFFGGYFVINSIVCQKDAGECEEATLAELNRLRGEYLLTFQEAPTKKKLQQSDPAIEEVTIVTKLPDKLVVNIKTRRPTVILKTSEFSNALIADEEGFIFAVAKPEDGWLPTIVAEQLSAVTVGDKISNPSLLAAISLAKILKEQYITFQEIRVEDNKLQVFLDKETLALFSHEQDLAKAVNSLQQILSQVTIDSKPRTIDLRYKKPVVLFD